MTTDSSDSNYVLDERNLRDWETPPPALIDGKYKLIRDVTDEELDFYMPGFRDLRDAFNRSAMKKNKGA